MFDEREMLFNRKFSPLHHMGECSLKQNLCFIRKCVFFPINKLRIEIVIRALKFINLVDIKFIYPQTSKVSSLSLYSRFGIKMHFDLV